MDCPKCSNETKVTSIYLNREDGERYRKYKCKTCNHTFFTVEFVAENNESLDKRILDARRTR